jgi:hypothetical protein
MRGTKWFTKLDVRWGFNNVRIKEGDEWKGAFKTNKGLFEPTVMFFGMTNSPPTFQRMMNDIFREEIAEGWLLIYMDDNGIFSFGTKEEHEYLVKRVLQKARENQLTFKLEKCIFSAKSMEYLGMQVSEHGVSIIPGRIQTILDWTNPSTAKFPEAMKKQIQSFLGFCNYFRRFIQGFANVARPLHDLTRKEIGPWTESQEKAFQILKKSIIDAGLLIYPDSDKPFTLQVDASQFAIGGALLQRDPENRWRPISFFSRALHDAE